MLPPSLRTHSAMNCSTSSRRKRTALPSFTDDKVDGAGRMVQHPGHGDPQPTGDLFGLGGFQAFLTLPRFQGSVFDWSHISLLVGKLVWTLIFRQIIRATRVRWPMVNPGQCPPDCVVPILPALFLDHCPAPTGFVITTPGTSRTYRKSVSPTGAAAPRAEEDLSELARHTSGEVAVVRTHEYRLRGSVNGRRRMRERPCGRRPRHHRARARSIRRR